MGVAEAFGYLTGAESKLRAALHSVVGTLVRLVVGRVGSARGSWILSTTSGCFEITRGRVLNTLRGRTDFDQPLLAAQAAARKLA